MKRHSLEPKRNVHKAIISTPCNITGEYSSQLTLITPAVPLGKATIRYDPRTSRSTYVVATKDKTYPIIMDYSSKSELICSYLSLMYGKRFDYHGLIEHEGFYHMPNFSRLDERFNPHLPFNSHEPRKCFPFPTNLADFHFMDKMMSGESIPIQFLYLFNAACKLYMQALRNVESEDETAYLNLVMAGEILARHNTPKKKGKERFTTALTELVDDKFFSSTESNIYDRLHGLGFFKKNGAGFKKHIGNAYELRNKYVHHGIPFGTWIRPDYTCQDIQIGRPNVDEETTRIVPGYGDIVNSAPTFIGLERTIRYCLLKMLEKDGYSDSSSSPSSPMGHGSIGNT